MSVLDPKWKYRRACETDVRKTFARERKKIRRAAALKTVVPIKRKPNA